MDVYPRLLARRFEAMTTFYTDGLGLTPARTVPGHYLSFDLNPGTPAENTALAIIAREDFAELIVADNNDAAAAADRQMVVLRVARVDDWTERVVTHGGTLVQPPTDQPYGLRSAHFRDPDGNLVELQQY
jgi:catechol 2,3-dioxygenase-like lactoylglutathione lyase family enzyme